MSLKADLAKLLKALPAGTPFGAGAVWSDYWSQVSAEEVRQLLVKADLSREEMLALLGQQHALILESVQEIADESQQREVQALFEQRKTIEGILVRLDQFQPNPHELPDLHDLVAVIPVGGPGGGMQPLTAVMPKALVPIDTKPLLIHIIESLDKKYFRKAIVTADVWYDMVKSYGQAFLPKPEIEIEYQKIVATPPQQLKKLHSQLTEPFLLHYGDIRTEELDWQLALQMYQHHRNGPNNSWFMGMALVSKSIRLGVGVVRPVDSAPFSVGEFIEHPDELPSTALISMGVGLFEPALVDRIRPGDVSVFGDVIPRAIKKEGGKLTYYQHGKWDHLQHMDELYDCQARYYPHMRPNR
jgi:dTDP-glucose pyrophosphorylase